MRLLGVESANLLRVGYDPRRRHLGVVFVSRPDVLYTFRHVTPRMFLSLVTADSIGRFFNQHIRSWPNRHPYTAGRVR